MPGIPSWTRCPRPGALAGLAAVALGQSWGDPVAGLAVAAFICHVGYEVTGDVVHRLADDVDPGTDPAAEAATGSVPSVVHAHARPGGAGGRTLRVEIEGWVDPDLPAYDADAIGREVAEALSGSFLRPTALPGQAAQPRCDRRPVGGPQATPGRTRSLPVRTPATDPGRSPGYQLGT